MRILMVNQKAYPSVGGKQRFTSRLAAGLTGEGQEVEVIATVTRPPRDGRGEQGYGTTYRPSLRRFHRSVAAADVIHLNVFCWRAILLGLLLRKPMLYAYHESGDRLCARALGWRWWERRCGWSPRVPCIWCEQIRILRSPRHWFLDPIKQRVMDRFVTIVGTCRWFLPRLPAHARYVPYGVPMDLLVPAERPSRDFLLFAARLVPEKGGRDVIRALGECAKQGHRPRLIVIGDGPERGPILDLARALDVADQVELVGEVPMETLATYYAHALAVIVPSVWEEMFGTISVEAMACRTPVIASAVGGMVETVGAAGLLFPPGDAAELADRILRVLLDPELAAELARRGYDLAHAEYEVPTMVRSYLALYQERVFGTCTMPEQGAPGPGSAAPRSAQSDPGSVE